MKSLFIAFTAICLSLTVANAQVLLTCSNSKTGAKVVHVSKSGQDIVIRVDWNEGSGFTLDRNLALTNATCSNAREGVGGGYKDKSGNKVISKEYYLRQTDPGKAVSIAWKSSGTIAYCGGSAAATVPGTGAMLSCTNSRTNASVNFVSKSGKNIVIRVDWNEGSGFTLDRNLALTNATCSNAREGVGGGYKDKSGKRLISKEYYLTQTDASKAVTIAWKSSGTVRYCGGDTPATVPGT